MDIEELMRLAWDIDAKLYGEVRAESLIGYLSEEIVELKEASVALEDEEYSTATRFNQIEEFGDVLFCLLAFARQKDINVAYALSLTIMKLQDRFKRKNDK